MNLSDLLTGEKGIIVKIKGRGAFRKRITDMGFIKGGEVEVIKSAPLRDPVEYKILGYNISLRRSEAGLIEIVTSEDEACLPRERRKHSDYALGFRRMTKEECADRKNPVKELLSEIEEKGKTIIAVLVGNPNSGKTTLFNSISGRSERVGNYSGVTVEAKSAEIKLDGYTINIIDLPGIYSLSEYSPEELIVREFISNNAPDVVINIIDSSNIERNMYLTSQLIDMDVKTVCALNMFDELTSRGDKFDYLNLGAMLGIPFVPTVGSKDRGIEELLKKVIQVYEDRDDSVRHIHINYGHDIENAVSEIQGKINCKENLSLTDLMSSRYLSLKLLEKDENTRKLISTSCSNYVEIIDIADAEIQKIEEHLNEDTETIIADARYAFIAGALKETYTFAKKPKVTISEKIDSVLTHRFFGIPIFMAFMWLTFQLTFSAGEIPKSWLESLIKVSIDFTVKIFQPGLFRDLITDGIISGAGGIIVFLPNILILFFMISLMEDSGYMARAAFIMDRVMHKIGLHGRSFIPLLMGFGCNVPAIMATRTIESRSERILTMMIIPFMSCSARLPVYVVMISAFFPEYPGTMLFAVYLLGSFAAVGTSLILKKTVFKKSDIPFVMELPPYRSPKLKATARHMWDKAAEYMKKIAGTILIASLVIWALGRIPVKNFNYDSGSGFITKEVKLEDSALASVGHFISPAMAPLGFDWKMSVSLLSGFAAKEIVVSTMSVMYNVESKKTGEKTELINKFKEQTFSDGPKAGQKVFTKLTAFGFIIFVLLYFPCVGAISAIRRESGSWKWPLIAVVYTTVIAWITVFIIHQIGIRMV